MQKTIHKKCLYLNYSLTWKLQSSWFEKTWTCHSGIQRQNSWKTFQLSCLISWLILPTLLTPRWGRLFRAHRRCDNLQENNRNFWRSRNGSWWWLSVFQGATNLNNIHFTRMETLKIKTDLRERHLLFFLACRGWQFWVDEAAEEQRVLCHSLIFAPTTDVHLKKKSIFCWNVMNGNLTRAHLPNMIQD